MLGKDAKTLAQSIVNRNSEEKSEVEPEEGSTSASKDEIQRMKIEVSKKIIDAIKSGNAEILDDAMYEHHELCDELMDMEENEEPESGKRQGLAIVIGKK